MAGEVPCPIKIYHIVHIDRLSSIIQENALLCDAEIQRRASTAGTTIGLGKIKERRLKNLTLKTFPDLHVGDCVPFYFCPRSVMLYMFYCNNHSELEYHGGQEPILHLVADMYATWKWAEENHLRCAFTTSNAGSSYFDDYADKEQLCEINWEVVQSRNWQGRRDQKQAEFLVEQKFPWELVETIGVYSTCQSQKVSSLLSESTHRPRVEVQREWYY